MAQHPYLARMELDRFFNQVTAVILVIGSVVSIIWILRQWGEL